MKTLTKSPRPGYTGGKSILKKVRSKTNSDIYYTFSNWDTREIEGITFIPVVKEVPDPVITSVERLIVIVPAVGTESCLPQRDMFPYL